MLNKGARVGQPICGSLALLTPGVAVRFLPDELAHHKNNNQIRTANYLIITTEEIEGGEIRLYFAFSHWQLNTNNKTMNTKKKKKNILNCCCLMYQT